MPGQVQEIGSDKVTIGEKRAIAKALIAVKDDFDIRKVDTDYTKFNLARKFVTKDSWLMFHLLDLLDDPDKTEWLNQDVKQWRGAGYERFVKFVRNVDVVNDCSER